MINHNPHNPARVIALIALLAVGLACGKAKLVAADSAAGSDSSATATDPGAQHPDAYPVMQNRDMPFRYPPALYADKVQGDVTLRLYVDRDGAVVGDSIQVAESSKVPLLDSAAIKGAHDLHFVPATLRGTPMPVTILFPVYFRHPEAVPGDSAGKLVQSASNAVRSADSSNTAQTSSRSKTQSRRRHRSSDDEDTSGT